MTQFNQLRAIMVDNQLRTSGVTSKDLLAEMARVPRERFVPADRQPLAYSDHIQWLGNGATRRFMMPPALLARLLQLAQITPDDVVLDVGAGTGYATAVIAGLAHSVTGVEPDTALAAAASANLGDLGIGNASVVAGDLTAPPGSGYDVIVVQGSLAQVPQPLFAALKDGGRLIGLMRSGGVAVANVFIKSGTSITAREEFNATLPPLDQVSQSPEFVF